jgi:adenosylcobinamide kinase / adenosylcobinamide-phosphate guanylyltransferase
MIELFLGGARSGKSALAEQRAEHLSQNNNQPVIYIATATADDGEMSSRISIHKARRPKQWLTVEESLNLTAALKTHSSIGTTILVDCLTLWLSNHLMRYEEKKIDSWQHEKNELLNLLPSLTGHIIMVSNEVGLGVVPMGALTRKFCDESGLLHQEMAQICDRVTLVTAGLPLQLKG